MNKIIWMCWFQGEDSLKFKRHIACIKQWRKLNSTWEVNVLSDKTIGNYVPEYFNYEKIGHNFFFICHFPNSVWSG